MRAVYERVLRFFIVIMMTTGLFLSFFLGIGITTAVSSLIKTEFGKLHTAFCSCVFVKNNQIVIENNQIIEYDS